MKNTTEPSEYTYYSSDTYSDTTDTDEESELEGEKYADAEDKAWTEERLKFYDILEKARYQVNTLEQRFANKFKRTSEDSEDSRPSKKSRSSEEEDDEPQAEIYTLSMPINRREDGAFPLEEFNELVEQGFIQDDEDHGNIFWEDVLNVFPLADEDEYLLEAYANLLANPERHVHWADQVDNEYVGEYAIYSTTAIDRSRHSALESWLIDSGATVHVTTTDKDMVDVKETSATVIVGDGKEVPATSRGTLLLATEDNQVIKL
jgi:hypothetical protein